MKKYWQAKDTDDKVFIFTEKPYRRDGIECRAVTGTASNSFLFPVALKPLQIAEITVNENGTWTYEIEREEGWYMAKWSNQIDTPTGRKNVFVECKNGEYLFAGGKKLSGYDLSQLTISNVRIPDECVI